MVWQKLVSLKFKHCELSELAALANATKAKLTTKQLILKV